MSGIARHVHRAAFTRHPRLRLIPCALALAGLPLAALATDLSGTINVSAPQIYPDAVTLVGDTLLQSTNGSAIKFMQTVDGGYDFVIDTAGTTVFIAAVGSQTPLAKLQTGIGAVAFEGGTASVTTIGAQSYAGPANFSSALSFTGSTINFAQTLDGGAPLALTASSNVTLQGAVGDSTMPYGLTINAGSLAISSTLAIQGPTVWDIATGGITQAAPFHFAAPLAINAQDGPIMLGNPANTFNAPLTLYNTGPNDVVVANTASLLLDSVNLGSGTLAMTGAGIHQTGSLTLVQAAAAGAAVFTDATTGGITLDSSSNDFTGIVSLSSAGVCSIIDGNALTLGTHQCNPLLVTSNGQLDLGQGVDDTTLQAASNGGDIIQSGPLFVGGSSVITIDAGTGAIALTDADNDFSGAVALTGGAISLRDTNDLNVASLHNGANQPVTLVAGGTLNLGTIAIDTGNADLWLQSGAMLGIVAPLAGAQVSLQGNGITLDRAVVATADLSLTSQNASITQPAGWLQAGGTSTIDAGTGAITLVSVGNDFTGVVNLTGGATQIRDANALSLGTVSTTTLVATTTGALSLGTGGISGNLVANSHGGAINQSGALQVTGTSSLNAASGSITLTEAGNAFDDTVNLTGSAATLTAGTPLVLGTINATSLSLSATQGARLSGAVTSTPIALHAGNLTIAAASGTTGALTLDAGTSVSGTGTTGAISGNGSVSPGMAGATSGSLSAASYTPSSSSALVIHADAAGGSTRLAANGAANLQGRLVLQFIGGAPASNATYTVLAAASITGQFTEVTPSLPGVTATAHYNTGATPNTVTVSIETAPVLTLDIGDDSDYAAYGAVNDYAVTLKNTGAADAGSLALDGTLSAAFDSGNATWQCSATGGAQCTASGNGLLHDAAITMPAGGSATWHITAPLHLVGNQPDATAAVSLTGSTTLDAADTDTLVLLRNGFDDDSAASPTITLHSGQAHAFELPPPPARLVDTVLAAHLDDGNRVLVQRYNLDDSPRLRLLWQSPALGDIASNWSAATASAELSLHSTRNENGDVVVTLEGTGATLGIRLSDD